MPDWRRTLAEVRRVLKPAGRLYAEEVLEPFIRRTCWLLDYPRLDRFAAPGFVRALEAAGLELIASVSCPMRPRETADNVGREHVCCAIAGHQHQEGVDRKKDFLLRGFGCGLVFRKLDVRGKVFIEYAPAETAWRPVVAPGYLVIHCLWVSGRYRGQGLDRELLGHCLEDVGERRGVVAVSGRRPYLTDTRFYLHHGFELVDRTDTGFDLVSYERSAGSAKPRFAANARRGTVSQKAGVHFEYAYQCPFVPDCVRAMSAVARELGLAVTTRELDIPAGAQRAASPFGTFGAFLHGGLVTRELMSAAKFRKLLESELSRSDRRIG